MRPRLVLSFSVLLLALASSASARLGDTLEQAQARYGLQKKPIPGRTPLIEGADEYTFEYQGFRIRCALLLASDGRKYVVREEYTKIYNTTVYKAGGTPQLKDYELDAILEGETAGKKWNRRKLGAGSSDPLQALANQITHMSGLTGLVWEREDGAVARTLTIAPTFMILELPQALKYEAELKAIKEQQKRAAVPKF